MNHPIFARLIPAFLLSTVFAVLWKQQATTDESLVRGTRQEQSPASRKLFSLSKNCPPAGFNARPNLDLESYISRLWYPIQAAPVIYQQGQSYCSVVQYTLDNKCFWRQLDNKPCIAVRNRGLSGSITGDLNDARIQAFVPNPGKAPAKIQVGPPQFLPFLDNYWVLAADTYDAVLTNNVTTTGTDYEWAIIAGGSADRETDSGKCLPGKFGAFDGR